LRASKIGYDETRKEFSAEPKRRPSRATERSKTWNASWTTVPKSRASLASG